MFACHGEEGLDVLLRFAQPLGDQVSRGDAEEGGVVGLCGDGLGQIGLTRSWGLWMRERVSDGEEGNGCLGREVI